MAGQSVGLVKNEEPTADIIKQLIEEAIDALDVMAVREAPSGSPPTPPTG